MPVWILPAKNLGIRSDWDIWCNVAECVKHDDAHTAKAKDGGMRPGEMSVGMFLLTKTNMLVEEPS